ncbi:hypothetical protein X777_15155 [Ooceraea biroi]|uniref:Uncharacterized protein n=1 Tax=Ooceraea biroi TaxID=2015173 RepID=A0A026VWD5_OOCBI|nr:hypothetical protein X777_15155 [Ooceraea biroi]
MPWKIGGNFQVVATKCEENWRECAIAIANYLWCEMVSDVVDCLGKEGMIWVLIVAITSTILLRVKYRRNTHTRNVVLGKQMLTKVGCKIHDLELKVNVLTYKMQYGTWPLPHQIYSLNRKKLQKIRMTLSDHKGWINQVLLSNQLCYRALQFRLSPINCRGEVHNFVEAACAITDPPCFLSLHSQAADTHLQNASTRDSNCSKSEDVTLRDRSCQEFEDTIHQYKSFLKELQSNNRHLHLSKCSSKTSKSCSLKQSIASFATETQNGDASHDNQVATVEAHETRCAKGINNSETMENGEETYRPNVAIPTSNDIATFSEEFCSTIRPAHNVQSSQETLHEIKRRLQSLHNVLQIYQDANRYSERDEELEKDERIDEVDASIGAAPEDADRCKTDTNCNVDSQENPPELQHSMDNCEYYDHSDGSLSCLTGCSSSTSKTYRCSSNTATRNPCSKESSRHCIARRPVTCTNVETSDLPAFSTTTKLSTCKQSSRLYSFATSQTSEDCTNCKTEDESFKDQNVQTQNGTSSRRFVAIFDNEEEKRQENVIVSQSDDRTLNESDREEKSTALLLQEALHFKKILLTRVDSVKGQPTRQETSENDIADESIRECKETERRGNNDNFPSMILDIKTEKPINGSCERMNQHYVYLEMKQRREEESENRICEASSKYFSITDFGICDDDDAKIGSNVLSSLEPPIYEKVISITIPVDARSRDEISANSAEKLRRNRNADDIGDNVVGRSPTTRKLEDLVLERIRNIRDCMDTFLRNRNKAISKVRRALQYRGESDAMFAPRCSNEASHVMLHKRDNCIDQAVSFSSDSPDLLLKTWPNRREVLLENDILKYCSNMCLKRDMPKERERFALIAPAKSDAQSPETTTELEKKETISSSSMIFERPCEEDETYKNETKPTHKITDTLNGDSRKHERQTQDAESKPSAISSRHSLDGAETDKEIVEIVHEEPPAVSNDNSTTNSSSYFTNATTSAVKMDDVFPKSTLNLEQSHAISIVQKEMEQSRAISGENNFVEGFPDINVKLSELSSNLEYSSLKTLADSNLVPDESECDCSTSARATLNENIMPFCNGTKRSPRLFSLNGKEETLKTDDDSLGNTKRGNEIFANVMHSSPGIKAHSTGQLSQTYRRIKAKSDISLTANRRKEDLSVNLYPKRSLSFLTRHDSLAHVQRTLHQSHINVQYDDDKFAENKLQFANRSKSIVPPQRASTRSCIPISMNRFEGIGRVRGQTHARSPTRGPLTVSCREKTFSESHVKEDEEVAQRRSIPNRHSCVEETALDVQKDIFAKDLEKIDEASTDREKNPKLLSNESIVKSSSEEEMCSATDFLRHKNNFWIITVDRMEKEVTAKPSITDTYTSMSKVTLETN